MGFILFCSFLSLIAIVGTAYFYYQDKKEAKRHMSK